VARVKDLEARLQRAEQQLTVFQRISRLTVKDLSLSETLQAIVNIVSEFMSCDSCLLYILDGDELVLCASSNPHPAQIGKVRLQLNEGLTGWVARERRLLAISTEAFLDRRFKKFSELPEDTYQAFLSVPVIARNRVIGVLNVQHRQPHAHTGAEMEMLTTVGEQVGCLLALARMGPDALDHLAHLEFSVSSAK